MPVIVRDDCSGAAASIAGRTPNLINNGNTISVPLSGTSVATNGSGSFVSTPDGNSNCIYVVETGYDLSQPNASLRVVANINLAGLGGSVSGGLGPVLYSGTGDWVASSLINLVNFSRRGIRNLRMFNSILDLNEGNAAYFANFDPDASANYEIITRYDYHPSGVLITTTVGGFQTIYLETAARFVAATKVGLSMRASGYLVRDWEIETDLASVLISIPRNFQFYPIKRPSATDCPVEFVFNGDSPEGCFTATQSDFRSPGSGTGSGVIRNVPMGLSPFTLRDVSDTDVSDTVANSGVGPAILVLGDSIEAGTGGAATWSYSRNASYPDNPAGFLKKACLGDDPYAELSASLHASGGADGYAPLDFSDPVLGSYVTLMARGLLDLGDELETPRDIPITFIPCAVPGQGTAAWLPATDPFDITTKFGCACRRAEQHGGVDLAIISLDIDCWSGSAYGALTQAQTYNNLVSIGTTLYRLFGCKLLIRGPHIVSGTWWNSTQAAKQIAAGQACVGQEWCAGFVDNSDLGPPPSSDGLHIATQAFGQTVADRMVLQARPILAARVVESTGGGGTTVIIVED